MKKFVVMPNSRSLVLALALALAPGALAAEAGSAPPAGATSEATQPAGPFAFAPGEEIELALDYRGVHAGRARLRVGQPEGAVWPVICQARSDGMASVLDIREQFVTYWDAETHTSRGSDLNAIEVGDRHTDRARFDRVKGKANVQVVRNGLSQERTLDVPHDVQDLASALLHLRNQPLAVGEHMEYPVFSGSDTFVLHAVVEGVENVETPAGKFETLRVRVQLGLKGSFATKRDSFAWLTNDAKHVPVRMSADFAVGTVTATLSGYRPGGQFAKAR
jgi:hypothetical protein